MQNTKVDPASIKQSSTVKWKAPLSKTTSERLTTRSWFVIKHIIIYYLKYFVFVKLPRIYLMLTRELKQPDINKI